MILKKVSLQSLADTRRQTEGRTAFNYQLPLLLITPVKDIIA